MAAPITIVSADIWRLILEWAQHDATAILNLMETCPKMWQILTNLSRMELVYSDKETRFCRYFRHLRAVTCSDDMKWFGELMSPQIERLTITNHTMPLVLLPPKLLFCQFVNYSVHRDVQFTLPSTLTTFKWIGSAPFIGPLPPGLTELWLPSMKWEKVTSGPHPELVSLTIKNIKTESLKPMSLTYLEVSRWKPGPPVNSFPHTLTSIVGNYDPADFKQCDVRQFRRILTPTWSLSPTKIEFSHRMGDDIIRTFGLRADIKVTDTKRDWSFISSLKAHICMVNYHGYTHPTVFSNVVELFVSDYQTNMDLRGFPLLRKMTINVFKELDVDSLCFPPNLTDLTIYQRGEPKMLDLTHLTSLEVLTYNTGNVKVPMSIRRASIGMPRKELYEHFKLLKAIIVLLTDDRVQKDQRVLSNSTMMYVVRR